jgi:hypothetical protein
MVVFYFILFSLVVWLVLMLGLGVTSIKKEAMHAAVNVE